MTAPFPDSPKYDSYPPYLAVRYRFADLTAESERFDTLVEAISFLYEEEPLLLRQIYDVFGMMIFSYQDEHAMRATTEVWDIIEDRVTKFPDETFSYDDLLATQIASQLMWPEGAE